MQTFPEKQPLKELLSFDTLPCQFRREHTSSPFLSAGNHSCSSHDVLGVTGQFAADRQRKATNHSHGRNWGWAHYGGLYPMDLPPLPDQTGAASTEMIKTPKLITTGHL